MDGSNPLTQCIAVMATVFAVCVLQYPLHRMAVSTENPGVAKLYAWTPLVLWAGVLGISLIMGYLELIAPQFDPIFSKLFGISVMAITVCMVFAVLGDDKTPYRVARMRAVIASFYARRKATG